MNDENAIGELQNQFSPVSAEQLTQIEGGEAALPGLNAFLAKTQLIKAQWDLNQAQAAVQSMTPEQQRGM